MTQDRNTSSTDTDIEIKRTTVLKDMFRHAYVIFSMYNDIFCRFPYAGWLELYFERGKYFAI